MEGLFFSCLGPCNSESTARGKAVKILEWKYPIPSKKFVIEGDGREFELNQNGKLESKVEAEENRERVKKTWEKVVLPPPLSSGDREKSQKVLRQLFTLVVGYCDNTKDLVEQPSRKDLVEQAISNGNSLNAFKTWVRERDAKSLCGSGDSNKWNLEGEEIAKPAVREILENEFAFCEDRWGKLVYSKETDKYGLGVKIEKEKTRSPFKNVLNTRMGRGKYIDLDETETKTKREIGELGEGEVLAEIQELILDWHDLFADACPFIGKLLLRLDATSIEVDSTNNREKLENVFDWLNKQKTRRIEYDQVKKDYVNAKAEKALPLRDHVRRFILTMYVYEKMSLRSLIDPHFLASLHRYYEGGLTEEKVKAENKEDKGQERQQSLINGGFGSFFMQLKQASVSVTFPGLSAMKNNGLSAMEVEKAVRPEEAAGLLSILSVNIFEAAMGELLVNGRLGNGACGVVLIGTESQKPKKYVHNEAETPHLVKNASFHKTILFGQGKCPDGYEKEKVCPTNIPLDREYLNAYTSWNALFTTTMSDNHIVFAKLLYPRMLRAMIYDPGQWGDQRPWSLYIAVSAFWLRSEQKKDFFRSVDFFAAKGNTGKAIADIIDNVETWIGGALGAEEVQSCKHLLDFQELADLEPSDDDVHRKAYEEIQEEENDEDHENSDLTSLTSQGMAALDGMFRVLGKPELLDYPSIIQFWTEMNHRYADLMIVKNAERYNLSSKFYQKYEVISDQCREKRTAVDLELTTFIIDRICKMGGRTHHYLKRFYEDTLMEKELRSSVYWTVLAREMDMKALIKKTGEWSDDYKLPGLPEEASLA